MVPIGRSTVLACAVVLVVGCLRGERRLEEGFQAALARADAAWEARDVEGFEAVATALDAADALIPGRPEASWRRARLSVGAGIAEEDEVEAMRHFATARVAGLDCLARAGAVEATARERFATVVAIPPSARPCVDWTALAWSQWITLFGGGGAAVDLERVDQLIAWAADGQIGARGPHAGIALWAEGLLFAARPEVEGRDLARAGRALTEASAQRPRELSIRADLVLRVAQPTDDQETIATQVRRVTSLQAATPEDRRAQARLAPLVRTSD